ncbi:hypothetical protein EV421DRAFT_1973700 [Armillaria borealis]|uniref:DUF6589 domain-containing protein n=1 Tax=Armillaria borealis TaxID=47425 RepID=A0AA39MLB1_9AGAR|nr:hypothetical protein EV421DRAFT_1973700 [Armillaria borealis]
MAPAQTPLHTSSSSSSLAARLTLNDLPPSSPPRTSPDIETPLPVKRGRDLWDFDIHGTPLDPISTDGPEQSSPVRGTPAERAAINRRKGQKKRNRTLQLQQSLSEGERTQFIDDLLRSLEEKNIVFGDVMLHVFDPQLKRGEVRWRGFFEKPGMATTILNFWVDPSNSSTARAEVRNWAINYCSEVLREEAHIITESRYLQSTGRAVNADFVLDFDIEHISKFLHSSAGASMKLLSSFATSTRQLVNKSVTHAIRKSKVVTFAALSLLGQFSQRNNWSHRVMALYLYASGAQRQVISVMSHIGITESYSHLTSKVRTLLARAKRQPRLLRAPFLPPDTLPPASGFGPYIFDSVETGKPSTPVEGSEPMSLPIDSELLLQKLEEIVSIQYGTLRELSQSMCLASRKLAFTGLFVGAYDNINFLTRTPEQALGHTDVMENGTCATIWKLWNASPDDMKIADLNISFNCAPPLSLDDLLPTPAELALMDKCLIHCLLRILVMHGGPAFTVFQSRLDKTLPVTEDKIKPHKTELHPMPAWNIDESTIIGQDDVVHAIYNELCAQDSPLWSIIAKILAGDQLTIARLRSLANIWAGHEGDFAGFGWGVWILGLFHAKIADAHGFLVTHWGIPNKGTRNPGCLAFHNTVLHRNPIVLTSLPPFRTVCDLIFVSLYACVLHCFLLVSGKQTLAEYADSINGEWDTLVKHAQAVYEQYANGSLVDSLRFLRAVEMASEKPIHPLPGDEIFENAVLFIRDRLITRELADAVKAGDSGRVLLVLKLFAFSFQGNGHTKYAHEMLHLIHNITHVWPKPMRKIVLDNWILFPSGNPNSGVECDLMQEHMNFWIKTFYQAHGSGASWKWLEMIAPCVGILRDLAAAMRETLGTDIGVRHAPVNLSVDIPILMQNLTEFEVYKIRGHQFEPEDGAMVPNVITAGIHALSSGTDNPLDEYNKSFLHLQARRRLQPIIGERIAGPMFVSEGRTMTVDPMEHQEGRTIDGPAVGDESDVLMELVHALEDDNATLPRLSAEDVALDMDLGDSRFVFEMDERDSFDEERINGPQGVDLRVEHYDD